MNGKSLDNWQRVLKDLKIERKNVNRFHITAR